MSSKPKVTKHPATVRLLSGAIGRRVYIKTVREWEVNQAAYLERWSMTGRHAVPLPNVAADFLGAMMGDPAMPPGLRLRAACEILDRSGIPCAEPVSDWALLTVEERDVLTLLVQKAAIHSGANRRTRGET